MTKSGEVIFSHYFNYQAKRSNQPHNDGCWVREGERGRERVGDARERGEGSRRQKKTENGKNICIDLGEKYTFRERRQR